MTTKEILKSEKISIGRQDRTVLADSIDDGEVFADWNKDGVFVKIRFGGGNERDRFEYYGIFCHTTVVTVYGDQKYLGDLWGNLKVFEKS